MKFNDYWKIPKNAKSFFSPKQEKLLKEKYGKLYILYTILPIVILLISFIVFLSISPSNAFEPTTQNSNLLGALGGILGLFGSLLLSVGIINIFMFFIKQYLGHFVTLIAIIGGVILDGLGLFVFSFVK